ncbi:hemicentin-1 isoform X2 [Denticeps clupeoides]|uniref:hemicentin-1 isoform X2 n=1 Tax=Denticeps clupeoides TaxID=299321 RepID=UPI0010A36A60|nr:hemicentin-1-like isoform X2 [Denticeps clupeoides]
MNEKVGLWFTSVFVLTGLVRTTEILNHLRVVLTGPDKAYLSTRAEFQCEALGASAPIIYRFVKDNRWLIDFQKNLKTNKPVRFYGKVTASSAGMYFCNVKTNGKTSNSNSIHLQVVIPVIGARLLTEPDPPILYEGVGFRLRCEVEKGSHLSYTWYHNRQKVSVASAMYNISENMLTVKRATEHHGGSYFCMACNQVGNITRLSNSNEEHVVIKTYLTTPQLSYSVYKENSSYHANMSCHVSQGSTPVTFRLLLNGQEAAVRVSDSLAVWFSVPVFLEMDMGTAQCLTETHDQQILSNSVDLEVVWGTVSIHVEYLYNQDSQVAAARLKCDVSRGTFPSYAWIRNYSLLITKSDHHSLIHGQILVLMDLSLQGPGYYHCLVRDSFNNNRSWMQSREVFVEAKGKAVVPIEIIAVGFCGFMLLVLLGVTCFIWTFDWQMHEREMSSFEELPMSAVYLGPESAEADPDSVEHHFMVNTVNFEQQSCL